MSGWTNDDLNKIRAVGVAEVLPVTAPSTSVSVGEPAMLVGRREFVRGAVAGVAGLVLGTVLSGCSNSSQASPTSPMSITPTSPIPRIPPASAPLVDDTPEGTEHTLARSTPTSTSAADTTGTEGGTVTAIGSSSKILLVYFSRAGENYYYGGRTQLEVGNTEVVAGMISRLIGCDVHRIEPADPYPDSYTETVERNVREEETNARPAIANPLASIGQYSTVLLGSPIWNVRAPMIMTTFVEGFNFTGKTVFPFTTYAMSGLGTTVRDYTASCPGATIGEGLAVQGEKVHDVATAAAVEAWVRRIGLLKG